MRLPLRSLAISFLMVALVLAVPRYAQDETGGAAGDDGASTTPAPNPSEQAPPEIAPDHDPRLPVPNTPQENGDPTRDGTPSSPDPE
jgi:hypothetical protein